MGTQEVQSNLSSEEQRVFMKALLTDIRALGEMLDRGMFETGCRCLGAEQEVVLVDSHWQPAPLAMEILEDLDDERITTEIARFNLECNLQPMRFGGDCLSRLEKELHALVAVIREACHRHGAEVVLTGILPTLAKGDLDRKNIADRPRYFALDDALTRLRGGAYQLSINGIDELEVEHDSVILEALNTSFQLHYQVDPDDFCKHYNIAQAVAAPILAAAVNSPILFGKRLWRETRIAIFQQTVDTRLDAPPERELLPRVRFGEDWARESVLEIYKSDVARFRVILGREVDEDPLELIEQGKTPKLQALQLHNSTVYRWNRACYGISASGKPHLRIENRVLPAGPSILDETANAAFWFGLMRGFGDRCGDPADSMEFDSAKGNFLAAARQGLNAEFQWCDGRTVSAQNVILDELIPVAREGLDAQGVAREDIDRYLDVIEGRVRSRRTGAQWLLDSVGSMREQGTRAARLTALTSAVFHRQQTNSPGHTWEIATLGDTDVLNGYHKIEQFMTTDLFTVHEDELIDLVATLMDWERIRHVPVEDDQHRLVGLVSYRAILRLVAKSVGGKMEAPVPVRDIMHRDVHTVEPGTPTLEAIRVMREHRIACLPVVKQGRLVGIVTEHDFAQIASHLLEQHLGDQPPIRETMGDAGNTERAGSAPTIGR